MTPAQKTFPGPQSKRSDVLRIEPRIYHCSAYQNVSVGIWVGQATLPAVQGLVEVGKEMNRRFPEGHSSITFVLDQLPGPTPEARELLTKIFQGASALSCAATIVEGTGFWSSGLRSMISNTHRAASGPVRLRVSTTIDEVLAWLPKEHEACTGVALDPEQLRKVLLERRASGAAAALAAEPT